LQQLFALLFLVLLPRLRSTALPGTGFGVAVRCSSCPNASKRSLVLNDINCLRCWGLTPQKPIKKVYEQRPEAIEVEAAEPN
jgi:hypothetical protein